MSPRTLALAAAGVLAAVATAAAPATSRGAGPVLMDHPDQQVDCESAQLTGPEATSTSHVAATPDDVGLEVLLVLDLADGPAVAALDDGTAAGRAAYERAGQARSEEVLELLAVAFEPYEALGIDLVWQGWDLLAPLVDGAPRERTTESQQIIDLAKEQYGGMRPEGVDVVYVATDLDIEALGQTAVAGQADCIGGVANDDAAFAVGEVGDALVHPRDGIPIGPVTFYKDFAAKVAAHEIGHLLGGHHHYQECGTPGPVATAAARAEVGACTLMSNFVDFQTLPFSTLNGVVVRGHAEQFAAD